MARKDMGEFEKWTDVAGVRTRYFEAGSGSATIVFLHAGTLSENGFCDNSFAWEHNLPALAGEFRVLAFDGLGQGRTAPPATDAEYTYDAIVRHARAFLAATGAGRAHLVGHDEGALTALRLAFETPGEIASCTIVDSPTVAPIGDSDINLTLISRPYPDYGAVAQRWILDRQSYTPHHLDTGRYLAEAIALAETEGFREIREKMGPGQLFEKQLRSSLAKLRSNNFVRFREQGAPTPTLLIWGNQDPTSPRSFAESLFKLLVAKQRLLQLRLINHAGYMPFREQPAIFNEMLGGFVRALETVKSSG